MRSNTYNNFANIWRIANIIISVGLIVGIFLPYFTIKDSYSVWTMLNDYKPFMVLGIVMLIIPIVSLLISCLPNSLNIFKTIVVAVLGIGELITKIVFDNKLTSEADDVNEVFSDYIAYGYYVILALVIVCIVLAVVMLIISLVGEKEYEEEIDVSEPQPTGNSEPYTSYEPMSNPYDYNLPNVNQYFGEPDPSAQQVIPTTTEAPAALPVNSEEIKYKNKQAPLALQHRSEEVQPIAEVADEKVEEKKYSDKQAPLARKSSTDHFFQNNPAPADYYGKVQDSINPVEVDGMAESNDGMKNYVHRSTPKETVDLDEPVKEERSTLPEEKKAEVMESWVCSCGHINIEAVCPICGKTKESKNTRFCPKCGNMIADDIMFCDKCGTNVNMPL